MALTEKIRLALEAQGFEKLFKDHVTIWTGLANDARDLIKPHVHGNNPTVDDIKEVLHPLIVINRHYRAFIDGHSGAHQQYWSDRFTDYVLHRVYQPTLKIEKKKEQAKEEK